jgi:hypothetical protein
MPSYAQCTRDCNDAFVDGTPEVPLDPLGLMAGCPYDTASTPALAVRKAVSSVTTIDEDTR